MSDQMPGLPGPAPDPTTEGYWVGAGRGELVVQVCSACGTHRHPPTEACYVCNSLDWAWDPHHGLGTVYTYTWTDRPVVPGLAHLGVYNVSVVELEGTTGVVRILTRVTDVERDDLVVGLPVEVHFDAVGASLGDDGPDGDAVEGDRVALPVFRPRRD